MNPQPRCPTCHRLLKRSSAANALYWALLHTMSERIRPKGQEFSAETWHEWCKSKFLGAEDIKLPDGRTLVIPHSSSDLDASEFAEYLTKVEAFAAERGVYLEDKYWHIGIDTAGRELLLIIVGFV